MKFYDANWGLIAACSMLLCSCSDEDLTGKTDQGDNSISFSTYISSANGKNKSRCPNTQFENFTAEKLDNSEMYLITAVEDGIDATKLATSDDASVTSSRSTMVSASNIASLYEGKGITLFAYSYDKKDTYNGKTNYSFADVLLDNSASVAEYIGDEYLKIGKPASSSSTTFTLTPRQRQFWTSSNKNITFFGIFPSKEDYLTNSTDYTVSTAGNKPTLSYVVEADVTKQRDFLCSQYSCSGDGTSSNYTANLGLKHIMSGISVTLGSGFNQSNDVITGVTFENVYTGGTYDLTSESWSYSKVDNIVFSCNADVATSALNSDNNTMFMMLPQTLTENSKISVSVYNKESKTTYQFTKTIKDVVWPMGKTVNFQISVDDKFTEYFIMPEYKTMYFSWDGTPAGNGDAYNQTVSYQDANGNNISKDFKLTDLGYTRVKSYKSVTDKNGITNYTELGWTAKLTSGSGVTYPDKSAGTEIASNDVDGTDYVDYNTQAEDYTHFNTRRYNFKFKVNIGKQEPNTVTSKDATKLAENKKIMFGSSSNYVDLSIYKQEYNSVTNGVADPKPWDDSKNMYTANSYMIKYPGYYQIPVVYGNGFYAGQTNSGAYNLGTSGYALKYFTDYADKQIATTYSKKPWLEYWSRSDNRTNPGYPGSDGGTSYKDTYVLWQDVKGMVQVVPYTTKVTVGTYEDHYFIRFYVDPEKMAPGNAVIKVTNNKGNTIWSYHIWVTPYSSSDTFTADANIKGGTNRTAQFLEVPLGYAEDNSLYYAARSAQLTLTQEESGKTAVIDLVQKEHNCTRHSCVYYQWGRKDPFPGATMIENGHLNYDDTYTFEYEQKPCYDGNGNPITMIPAKSLNTTVGSGIQNPFTFYTTSAYSNGNSNRFPDINYYDLWGCLVDDKVKSDPAEFLLPEAAFGTSTRKTIYDPCPPGFKVPPIYNFPAITADGVNHAATITPWSRTAEDESTIYNDLVNTPFTSHDEFINAGGFKFYKSRMAGVGKANKTGTNDENGTYMLYAMGCISTAGKFTGIGTDCLYWACTNWASTQKGIYNHRNYFLHAAYGTRSTFEPVTGNTESFGYPVLPMVGGK